jgi:hypothetical protein
VYVYLSAVVIAEVPTGVVTATFTVPMPGEASGEGGEVATICVDELTVNDVAGAVPKSTLVVPVRFVPVIVTEVPPDVKPDVGRSPVTVGN